MNICAANEERKRTPWPWCFAGVSSITSPLLTSHGELDHSSLSPSVYAGAFALADDICTVTSSLPSRQQQIHMVQNFAIENALVLNLAKCEVLIVSPFKLASPTPVCTIADQPLLPKENVKCLGYWWSWDLSATKAIMNPSRKPGGPFFPMRQWEHSKEN